MSEIIRDGETITEFTIRRIRNDVLRDAAKVVGKINTKMYDEAGDAYNIGIEDARDAILAMIDA